MGEWSKKVGEIGEDIIKGFLKKIGWADSEKGIEINCVKPQNHRLKNDRRTHGIDFLFSYPSPLIDETLDNIIISGKYSAEPYPNNPSGKFKENFVDLAQTIECFKKSHQRNERNQKFLGVKKANDIGVLFWFNSDKKTDGDVISKISNARININNLTFETIYVVDNKRMAFLYDTIIYIENKYSEEDLSFFYPDTGRNISPINYKNSGKILPVQYINTSILPIRLEAKTGETSLILSNIDNFEKDPNNIRLEFEIERKDLTKNWASSNSRFKGSLTLIKSEGKIRLIMTNTAAETKEVNSKLIKYLVEYFKKTEYLSKEAEVKKITFSRFKNIERIDFFLKLTKDLSSDTLSFKDTIDIEFCPENNPNLPERIKWMEQNIKKLKLNGQSLHETFFVKEKKYHDYLALYSLDAQFEFSLQEADGICIFNFSFPQYAVNKDDNIEFEVNVSSLKLQNEFKSQNRNHVKERLLRDIDNIKMKVFDKIVKI